MKQRRYRLGCMLALLGLTLGTGCSPWSVHGWSRAGNVSQVKGLLGLGKIKTRGARGIFTPDQPRRILALALRQKGYSVDTRALFRGNLPRDEDGFLTPASLLRLDSHFSGRYWIRGNVTLRPSDVLLETSYNIDLEIQFLDLQSGRTVQADLIHASEQPAPGPALLLQGFHNLDLKR